MNERVIIAVDAVSYSYPDGTCALRGISAGFKAGEKVAILGANGAGKTTLFLHLNGLLRPSEGSILFNERPLAYTRKSLKELRSTVQIVFQEPDTQLFSARVSQDIAFGALNLGLPQHEVLERVDSALKTVDIEHLRDKPTHFLSHGEKKRVAIAGSLVMNPQVLIIDEPTACVDPRHQAELLDLFNSISSSGATVLLSTHDVEMAWQWADRLLVMHEGRLVRDAAPEDIFSDSSLLDTAGLGRPLLLEVFETLRKHAGLQGSAAPKSRRGLMELLASALQHSLIT